MHIIVMPHRSKPEARIQVPRDTAHALAQRVHAAARAARRDAEDELVDQEVAHRQQRNRSWLRRWLLKPLPTDSEAVWAQLKSYSAGDTLGDDRWLRIRLQIGRYEDTANRVLQAVAACPDTHHFVEVSDRDWRDLHNFDNKN